MNSKLAILLSLALASGTALAAGEYDEATGAADPAADQGVMGQEQQQQQQQSPAFSEVDQDANGLITQEEAEEAGAQQVADNFDQADANADGYINRSEYESLLGEQTLQE